MATATKVDITVLSAESNDGEVLEMQRAAVRIALKWEQYIFSQGSWDQKLAMFKALGPLRQQIAAQEEEAEARRMREAYTRIRVASGGDP